MSNRGIRELKRKKRRLQKNRRRKILVTGLASLSLIIGLKVFTSKDDDFTIQRPAE